MKSVKSAKSIWWLWQPCCAVSQFRVWSFVLTTKSTIPLILVVIPDYEGYGEKTNFIWVFSNRWSSESHQARLNGRVAIEVGEASVSIFGEARDTIKWVKNQILFEFFRTDGAARAIMLACLAASRQRSTQLKFAQWVKLLGDYFKNLVLY